LDWLAGRGVKFSQAYHSGEEAESQMALLTGYFAGHLRRDPSLESGGVRAGLALPTWAKMLPDQLKAMGYRSYFAGAWLVGGLPKDAGFDRAYTVEAGHQFGPFRQTLDGEVLEPSQASEYASSVVTGNAVQFLREHAEKNNGTPFFACVALSLPDAPLQAAEEDIARYKGRFHGGGDELRKERLQRLKGLGMVANAELSEPTLPARNWLELSRTEQDAFETRMEIHAAMVERLDTEVGRLLEQIQAAKVWDNTLFVFASGQSASAERQVRRANDPKERVGGGLSYLCLEAQGASLANTPWRYGHRFLHEGGIASPFIVHWPGGLKSRGEVRDQVVHLADITPTVLKIAGGVWPRKIGNVEVPLADGVDLSAVLKENKQMASRGLWWGGEGHRAFRLGDWKWVALKGRPAELYYLLADRSELLDLAEANHERLQEMEVQWKRMDVRFEQDRARAVPVPSLSGAR